MKRKAKSAKTAARAKAAKKPAKNHIDSIVDRARENLRANGLSVDGPTLKQHVAILEGLGAIGKVDWGKPEKPAEPTRTTAAGMIMPGGPALPGTTPGVADAQSPNQPEPVVPMKSAVSADSGGRAES